MPSLLPGGVALAAGPGADASDHTCYLSGVIVKCWGLNSYGQLGTGDTTNRYSPATVSGLGSGAWLLKLPASLSSKALGSH